MKNLFFLLCLVFISTFSDAKVWRVNNTPGVNANFSTITGAMLNANVVNGDTIYLEASVTSYGAITVNKQVTIIGGGYFLSTAFWAQPPQFNTLDTDLDQVTVTAANVTITGVSAAGIAIANNANNCTITRCYVGGSGINITASASALSGIKITQNYVYGTVQRAASNYATDLVITNNIIFTYFLIRAQCRGVVDYNNINLRSLVGTAVNLGNSNFSFRNNIIRGASSVFSNPGLSAITNNMAEANILPAGNGNQNSVPMAGTSMWQNGVGTYTEGDANYQLSASSPAKTAGVGGTPIGAYGGVTPYIRSGIPAIPTVYGYSTPAGIITTPTIQVTFSSRTNN
jgi:hypothetical protein